MKFIYTLCKYMCLISIYICVSVNVEHKMCKCKNQYIYMVLHNYVFWQKGFHDLFGDKPIKWPIAKKTHQNMHPQLINMNLQEGVVIERCIIII
jgi:hypothetical protein